MWSFWLLCEASCGLVVNVGHDEAGVLRVLRTEGDRDDRFSQGYLCPKAAALADLATAVLDPLRLASRNLRAPAALWVLDRRESLRIDVTGAAATATRGTSSTSSAMDACQLVTKADAERTLGEPVNVVGPACGSAALATVFCGLRFLAGGAFAAARRSCAGFDVRAFAGSGAPAFSRSGLPTIALPRLTGAASGPPHRGSRPPSRTPGA